MLRKLEKLTQYISENRLESLILALSLMLGTFLRAQNLYHGRFTNPDEYRIFKSFFGHNSLVVPFHNIAYRIPLIIWGKQQHVALYNTVFWGSLSILLVFITGKILFHDRVGAYAAFLLSLSGLHIAYSRTAFLSVLQSFLVLAAFLFLYLYLNNKKAGFLAIAGIFSGLSFAAYVPSYTPVAAIFILLFIMLNVKGMPGKEIPGKIAVLGAASLACLLLIEIIARLNSASYFYSLIWFKKITNGYVNEANSSALQVFFGGISEHGGKFQLWLAIIGFLGSAMDWFWNRENYQLLLLIGFISFCYIIFNIMALRRVHTVYPRHFVYLIPFTCITIAYFLYRIEAILKNRYIGISCLLLFAILAIPRINELNRRVLKINHMTAWFARHGIRRAEIISRLDLQETWEEKPAIAIPGEWGRDASSPPYYKIHWPELIKICREEKIRYILTGGIGSAASTGYNDPRLAKFKPIMTWENPYKSDCGVDFALYDLTPILKPE
ncbi:MAG: glycosyltransferase family 39 protein [Elusimicrobia bacterium]|nr:glycosyltransferase family 39 protein [Elusimicrobiota bacterium]